MAKSVIPQEVWALARTAYPQGGWKAAREAIERAGYSASQMQIAKNMERNGVRDERKSRPVAPAQRSGTRLNTPKNGPISHIVIPDTQCKAGVELEHLRWAGRYIAEHEPDVVLHLGDHWDMPSLSSYESKGSRYFEGKRYLSDVEAGNTGLDLFEEGLRNFKPKTKILLRGNHENRITRAINEDPKLEGLIGFHQFNDVAHGWQVQDFLDPIEIDGLTFAHYFYQPNSGRPYSGAVDTMLRNIGFSFVMGHQQGLRWGRRELANGVVQIGCVAGSFYQHREDYRGYQARSEWRGILVFHEVAGGNYDPMFVSLDYLRRRFG